MRIVIADDHLMFRVTLKSLLAGAGFLIVGEATNGREALDAIDRGSPDCVILDMNMPVLNGIETRREMNARGITAKSVILTMFENDVNVIEAFAAGVEGFVLKSQAATDLIKALHEIREGRYYVSPGIAEKLVESCLNHDETASGSGLTARERQVLQLVAEGKPSKTIARLLNLTVKTIESHRNRLMRKLNVRNTAGLVRQAVREGVIRP